MTNSNTEHSKKLRAASAVRTRQQALAEGGINISVLVRAEDGAETFKKLAQEHGSRGAALRFLIKFYEENHE